MYQPNLLFFDDVETVYAENLKKYTRFNDFNKMSLAVTE